MKKTIIFSLFLVCCSGCFFRSSRETVPNSNQNSTPSPTLSPTLQNSNQIEETQISASADTLSVALTLFRKGKETSAEISDTFNNGDGVRLNVSVVESGFLYILYKGSDGDVQVIFPGKQYFKGRNEIEPHQNVVIPDKGWLFFDEKKGTETIYVVYSKAQNMVEFSVNPKQTLGSFDKLRSENNNADSFTDDVGNLVRVVELKHK